MLFTQLTDDPGRTQVVDGGPGRRDFVDLHTQVINPSTLDSTAAWNMATGRLVFRLDHPVISTVAHVERVDPCLGHDLDDPGDLQVRQRGRVGIVGHCVHRAEW